MAFFNFGGWYSDGSSPEVMVKAERCEAACWLRFGAHCRNRPRGQSEAEDQRLEQELLAEFSQVKGRACDAGRSVAATIWPGLPTGSGRGPPT